MNSTSTPWWRDRGKLPIVVFALVAGYFLVAEHRAHVIQLLPWIFILSCVGMHFFMHGGHGHGRDHSHKGKSDDPARIDGEPGDKQ